MQNELETAIRLAQKANDLILDFYEKGFEIEEKLGIDNFVEPVTIADKLASKLIVDGLCVEFPEDGILSEEEIDDAALRTSKKRAWMIDPIDGTQGFADRNGDFAVQIGLAEKGTPILGVVSLPFHATIYYAVKAEGAFVMRNDSAPEKLHVSDTTDFSQLKLAVSRNHLSPKMSVVTEDLNIKHVLRRGSVGLKIGLIAEKLCDLYIHLSPHTKFWDTCAPQIILEEAGGILTDLFGEKIRYDLRDVKNHNGVLASNGASHNELVKELKPLLHKFGRLKFKSKN